jgi:hypothetical protein
MLTSHRMSAHGVRAPVLYVPSQVVAVSRTVLHLQQRCLSLACGATQQHVLALTVVTASRAEPVEYQFLVLLSCKPEKTRGTRCEMRILWHIARGPEASACCACSVAGTIQAQSGDRWPKPWQAGTSMTANDPEL